MARTRKQPVDLNSLLPGLRERLVAQKFVRASELGRAGVPPAQRAQALALLAASGFERTRTGVRAPLRRQLIELLAERTTLPLGQLGKSLRGATLREARAAAEALAADGEALIVLRGTIEVLAATSLPTATREQLARLAEVGARAGKALRKLRRTLLRSDLHEQLSDLVALPVAAASVPPPTLADMAWAALKQSVRPSVGLAFVPDAVRVLAPRGVPAVQAALLDLARAGRIELQPESGLGRLSTEDLALCPPGPQGTRLSWARLRGAQP